MIPFLDTAIDWLKSKAGTIGFIIAVIAVAGLAVYAGVAGWQLEKARDRIDGLASANATLAAEKADLETALNEYAVRTANLVAALQAEREKSAKARIHHASLEEVIHDNKSEDRAAGALTVRYFERLRGIAAEYATEAASAAGP